MYIEPVRRMTIYLFLTLAVLVGVVPERAFSEEAQTTNVQYENPYEGQSAQSKAEARDWALNTGASLGGAVTNVLGDTTNLKTKFVAPILTGAAMFSSLSGSETGTLEQIHHKSSYEFLSLFINPMSTGDFKMIIRVDKNFDGTPEYTLAPEFHVSGVCGNGFISCPAGTWGTPDDHCKYLRWTSTGNADISIQEVSRASLAGCYCVNNDCGNNLVVNNVRSVLQDMGGGIVAGIQEKSPQFMITDAQVDGYLITYYGNDVTQSADYDEHDLQIGAQTAQFDDAWNLESNATSQAEQQSLDPDSDYSTLTKAMENQGRSVSYHDCTITRAVAITTQEDFCWDPDVEGIILKQNEITTFYKVLQSLNTKVHDDCHYGKYPTSYPDMNWEPPTGGPYEALSSAPPEARETGYFSHDYLYCDKEDGTDDGYYDIYNWYYICERTTDLFTENINDTCNSLATNSECHLFEETVDDVETVSNGAPTNLMPLPSTKEFPGELDLYAYERSWWRKERTYSCVVSEKFDFSNINKRLRNIDVEMGQDGEWSYTDGRRLDDGTWTSERYELENPNFSDPKVGCQKGCKTRKLVSDTDATLLNHTAATRKAAQSWDFNYRNCTTDGICPAKPEEQVYVNNQWVPSNSSNNAAACQCLNEFADASTAILSARMAGNDVICSDGMKKDPEPAPQLPTTED
jgi:hypothetical protein